MERDFMEFCRNFFSEEEYKVFEKKVNRAVDEEWPIDLRKDVFFKTFFGQETKESSFLRCRFIGSVIGQNVIKAKVLNPELSVEYVRGKSVRLDVLCLLEDGSIVDIEMQSSRNQDDQSRRAVYYASRLHGGGVDRGDKYKLMRKSYEIIVLGFKLLEGSKTFHRRFVFSDKNGELSDVLQIHTLELSRLPKRKSLTRESLEKLNGDEFWGIMIKYSNRPEVMDMMKSTERYMEEVRVAREALKRMNKSKEDWAREFLQEKMYRDIVSQEKIIRERATEQGLRQGIQQGLQQGIKQGLQQGMQEGLQQGLQQGLQRATVGIVTNMLNSGVFSDDQILTAAKISCHELEQIKADLENKF